LPQTFFFQTEQQANTWRKAVIGGENDTKTIITPENLSAKLDYEFFRHTIEDNKENRWQYIHKAFEAITNPDEIWASHHEKALYHYYIKWYKDEPLILFVNTENNNTAKSMYVAINKKTGNINLDNIKNNRGGVLKYRK
jgi:phage-Barnase-EndoU-ColicinE5/D-RelE like nuclease2